MFLLIVTIFLVLSISALCSLSEAALYSVRMPFVRQLMESGSVAGQVLEKFKQNMERPITAILIINTVANTAGATIAGSQAENLFGGQKVLGLPVMVIFSTIFTLAVLVFAEILPKVAGVIYGRNVAKTISLPLASVMKLLTPLMWFSHQLGRIFHQSEPVPLAPEEEVHQIATLSAEEGSILPMEAELVRNVLRLNEVTARDLMTPRTVVFTLQSSLTVQEMIDQKGLLHHTRIPIFDQDPENWMGVVLKNDVLACMARDEFDVTLDSLKKPLAFVPEVVPGHRLLSAFLKRRQHLLGVVDEYGGVMGIVTLEDVLEALIGKEIVDETDRVVDMQQDARRRGAIRLRDVFPDSTEKK